MIKLVNIFRKAMIIVLTVFVLATVIPTNTKGFETKSKKRMFEFRGAWVATVSNIDIGKQYGSTESAIEIYKQQFLNLLNVFEEYNLNVVIFQVRPLNDAFYKSSINPWSRFLIGTEGVDPGWDPMEWMIEEVHKRNMEFHAWMNPYRTSLDVVPKTGDYENEKIAYLSTLDDKNFAKQNPNLLVRGVHDKNLSTARLLLNPAREEVRQHIYNTISEVVRNYDVDAVHFDDYFYNGVDHSEDAIDYNSYKQSGGTFSKNDWRREQVNILIKGIHNLMKKLNTNLGKNVEFGISPAGVWAPSTECPAPYGQPGGMAGIVCYSYSSYVDLFADTRKWVNEEWIDYILPQNYGSFYRPNHKAITSWWANEVKDKNVKLYIGLAPYQYNSFNDGWDIPDMSDQLDYGYSFDTVSGFAMYNISNLKTATNNNMRTALDNLKARWIEPVFLPIKTLKTINDYSEPNVTVSRSNFYIALNFAPHQTAYAYAIYRIEKGQPFNPDSEKMFDIIYNQNKTFQIDYPANREKAYQFYIKTLYGDGKFGDEFLTLSVDSYDSNSRPEIKNLNLNTSLLVIEEKTMLNISGELYDADGDLLTVTIRISNRVLNDIILVGVEKQFSRDIYIPDFSFNRAYFIVTVSDGIDSISANTRPFYVPARHYTKLMQHIMTIEIITNDTVEKIYQ
ncbi:MAG: family 10 glycosylhydrolase [Bacilli bacterium]|nr:family 10 glycosylhydrolase [Bacilli bacterium]MDD4077251.1 family 10 glycosylhydrolase [Bacilli bacterium]MDD4388048.1 family 10 glycosylhydrolase [Bacilli bacterium]